jgi:serralysin
MMRALVIVVAIAGLASPPTCAGQSVDCLTDCPAGKAFANVVSTTPLQVDPNLWKSGQEIVIGFVDGLEDTRVIFKVMGFAREWEEVVNLRFHFILPEQGPQDLNGSDIRISFAEKTRYAAVGTSARGISKRWHTMMLGGINANDDNDTRRAVLHEFGHMLGFHHEHQNPRVEIRWNMAALKDAFNGPPNLWSDDRIKAQIIDRLRNVQAGPFDPESIMLYEIPAGWAYNFQTTHKNAILSERDKKEAAQVYPSKFIRRLGTTVRITPEDRRSRTDRPTGIRITSISKTSPIWKMTLENPQGPNKHIQLEENDVITRLNDARVETLSEFEAALRLVDERIRLRIWDWRNGGYNNCFGEIRANGNEDAGTERPLVERP